MSDTLDDRGRALEEQFFKTQNEQLVKKMKDAAKARATKTELKKLTGISDDHLLDALARLNIGAAAAVVMEVLPMVEVAWADGDIDARERKVILEEAAKKGLGPHTEASLVLAAWLDTKPDPSWTQVWNSYVKELCPQLSKDHRVLLKNEILGRARLVAEASGKVLGITSGVSKVEQAVLDRLEKAFA